MNLKKMMASPSFGSLGKRFLIRSFKLCPNKSLPFLDATGVQGSWSQRSARSIYFLGHLRQKASVESSRPWQLASAVCLERFPVVSQETNEIEQRYLDMIDNVELEKSALSQHELSVAADKRRMAKKQSGEQDEEEGDDGGDLLTALDLEDLATEELARFQTAPRITGPDEKDEKHSLDRKLCDKLVLIVKCRLGEERVWLLPFGVREEGETMRNVAERVLGDSADDSGALRAHFMGNAPVGFYKQRYPKAVQEQTGNAGVKVSSSKPNMYQEYFRRRKNQQQWKTTYG